MMFSQAQQTATDSLHYNAHICIFAVKKTADGQSPRLNINAVVRTGSMTANFKILNAVCIMLLTVGPSPFKTKLQMGKTLSRLFYI
jgi:hypothetical protein